MYALSVIVIIVIKFNSTMKMIRNASLLTWMSCLAIVLLVLDMANAQNFDDIDDAQDQPQDAKGTFLK